MLSQRETFPPHSPSGAAAVLQLAPDLFCVHSTCNVYIVRTGAEAVLVDFGDGTVLAALPDLGIERVTDILMTHHHRDQGQGLALAAEAGARIWAPAAEIDLFQSVDAHWQARAVANNYNVRQDRFSLLEPVPLAGKLPDYATVVFGRHAFTVVPTPGHTPGSITLLAEIDGRRVAFSGDLIAAPGKVWSLAATQWTYNGGEGAAASIASLSDLKERQPQVLLPSHGEPMEAPGPAIGLLVARLRRLLDERGENPRLFELRDRPYQPITPHLLLNRTSVANSYVLLSESRKALFIDFGYDFMTGFAAGCDRADRRPWLHTLPALKRDFGVTKVDVAIPTHYHDDHVAGLNLLRQVEGTQVWAAESFASILERPAEFDLPCLWFDPIPVDWALPLATPIRWEEWELTLYPLPGHTRYAVAISFEVDGQRVLAVGDQYEQAGGDGLNYVYANRFERGDYAHSAQLYARLQPSLILPGHNDPLWVQPGYLEDRLRQAARLEALHAELLPDELPGLGADGVLATIQPYHARVRAGETLAFKVEVRNPFAADAQACIRLVIPAGWQAWEGQVQLLLPGLGQAEAIFQVTPPAGLNVMRARLAAEVTIAGQAFGQAAEALVEVFV